MTAARDQLAAVAHQLEGQAQHMHQQLLALPQMQQELQSLQELHQRLQKDNQLQLQVRAPAPVS
jgi:prefoldin subunit 5